MPPLSTSTASASSAFAWSFGIIPAQYVLLALLFDVLDHMEAKNGFRSDGFTMVIYAGLAGLCNGI